MVRSVLPRSSWKHEPGEWRFTLVVIWMWRDEGKSHRVPVVNRWNLDDERGPGPRRAV